MNAPTIPRRLYRVSFRTPDPRAPAGPSAIDVVATGQTDAIVRACMELDALGVDEWALLGCEVVSNREVA